MKKNREKIASLAAAPGQSRNQRSLEHRRQIQGHRNHVRVSDDSNRRPRSATLRAK